ncbi:DUF4153 domain-containing protein [candidate division GN15 bacterium]|nr:DUF4153 domain-containing protein [candidate division GN15 bacterium]
MSISKRFPSYDHVLRAAGGTARRFPFMLLSALAGAAAAIIAVEHQTGEFAQLLQRLLLTAALGLPLFFALTVWAERQTWSSSARLAVQAAGVVLLVGYYLSLPADPFSPVMHIVRFLLLAIGLHFLVAFVPYMGGDQINGFWHYNKALFLRFLTAALYSAVLFVGLVIALAALDYLFGVDIPEDRYIQLWILMAGVFNTWFFLAGVPDDLAGLNQAEQYPKGLKVFTQFVLLPLVALYFVILIAYELKIVVTWDWPKGWVSQLVLWYSVVGILSLLLLYPLRTLAENRWVRLFITWFFRALAPLVIMLYFAILTRIGDYGFTENRYFVLAMAIGLTIVMIYFIVSRTKDIRIIPMVLCALAILSAFGPWSAFSVAESSQQGRLHGYINQYNLLDRAATGESDVPFEDRREISSIVRYLGEWHGAEAFRPFLDDSTLASLDTVATYAMAEAITRSFGVAFVPNWRRAEEGEWFSLMVRRQQGLSVAGYDYLVDITGLPVARDTMTYQFADHSLYVSHDSATATLALSLERAMTDSTRVAFLPLADTIRTLARTVTDMNTMSTETMTFELSSEAFEGRMTIGHASGYLTDTGVSLSGLTARVLLRLKE